MSTNNPISGHTDGTNDGLKDGDHILSPSLTNLYEGVHGNGILLPHDTAYGDSDRNDPPDLPGSISAGAAANQFVVKACDVILDGVLYAIGGGSDITVTLNLTGTAEMLGSFTALSSGQECLFVVIATPDGLKVSQTTNITTAVGAYPSITGSATAYLKTGSGAGDNRQSVVLGTVRATNAGGSTVGTLNIESLSEFNDKRVFVRPTPLYLSPVRDGTISSTTGINGHTALSQVHTGQTGTFGDNGIIWQSFNSAGESMLYYSAKAGANRHTHLLGPTNIDVSSPGSNQTFTFDGDRVFVLTPSTTINPNPSGTFPPGHSVFVSVPSGSTVTFDSTGLNQAITAGDAIMFAYDGTNWKRVLFSSTVATTSSGTSGVVQLSDGAGGFTSDSTLSYDTAANELTVDGKLTVTGLIDPTGLELAPQGANPGGVADNTLWLDSGASNRPKVGSSAIVRAGDNISELTNDSNFVDAAGAAAAASTDLAYDAGTRTVSSSTGTNAVITEVVAGGNSGLMTGADKTKLDGVAPSATAYADADAVAAVEAEAGLDFSKSSDDAIVENTVQDKDIIFKINDGGTPTEVMRIDGSESRVGIGTDSPTKKMEVKGDVFLSRQQTQGETRVLSLEGARNATGNDYARIDFQNYDNDGPTSYTGARISVKNEADGVNDGSMLFYTNNAASSLTERMRITDSGDVGIGTDSPAGTLHVKNSNTDYCALFESDDDGTSAAPDVALYRNGLTPANGDDLGHLIWRGTTDDGDSTVTRTNITDIFSELQVAATGTESGKMHLRTKKAGTMNKRISIEATKTIVNEDGVDVDFIIESDTNPNMFFVDAGNSRVGIANGSPAQALDVTGTIRQSTVTNAVLVADGNGDLTAASTLADVAYVLSGQAGADVYNPANPANWTPAPPLTIEEAIQRIAAVVAGQHGAIP